MSERVLVCVLGQTRAHEATWAGFEKHVLGELGAELALCIGLDDRYDFSNPFWRNARHRWTTPELDDFAEGFDQARSWFVGGGRREPADWRRLMRTPVHWLGGIKGPGQQPGSGAILIYLRWLLYRHLSEEAILRRYDRFIVTRSDFLWAIPHPPLRLLDASFLWVPDGERYGGITDRHLIASAADILPAINLMEEIVLRPKRLERAMRGRSDWNLEQLIRLHYERSGLAKRVRFFPYPAFAVRGENDGTRWARGTFDAKLGLHVKYASEKASAERNAWIRSADDWARLAASEPGRFHADTRPPLRMRGLSRWANEFYGRLKRLRKRRHWKVRLPS